MAFLFFVQVALDVENYIGKKLRSLTSLELILRLILDYCFFLSF